MKNVDAGYAIVRIDDWPEEFPPKTLTDIQHRVTIKEVVWTLEEAEKEVARLNELNGHKGCLYFWQYTRIKK